MRFPISTHPFRVIGTIGLLRQPVSCHRTLAAAQRAARRDSKGATHGYAAVVEECYDDADGGGRRQVYASNAH